MKIAIIGASGFLGTKLKKELSRYNNEIIGTYFNNERVGLHRLDITKEKEVFNFFSENKPEVVVNTAGIAQLCFCEKNKDIASKINHIGTKNIVNSLKELENAKLFYLSTSYVFDGKKGNYNEEDKCDPLNVYGKTKLLAEKEVLTLPNAVVLRTDFIYGYNGRNFPNSLLSIILKEKEMEVNNYQKRHPLFADDLPKAIIKILEEDISGIVHLAGPDKTTQYKMVSNLKRKLKSELNLNKILENDKIRPIDVSLNTSKAKSIGITFTSIDDGVNAIINSIEHNKKAPSES